MRNPIAELARQLSGRPAPSPTPASWPLHATTATVTQIAPLQINLHGNPAVPAVALTHVPALAVNDVVLVLCRGTATEVLGKF